MTWLLDAGNTRVKITQLADDGAMSTSQVYDYAEIGEWAAGVHSAERLLVACVAGNSHRAQLQEQLPPQSEWVQTPAAGLGIRCAYRDHRKWGVDRWLALAAVHASARTGEGSAVVDMGTATTFDICDASGQHLGGWIAPGPQALLQALGNGRTALPQAASKLPDQLGLAIDTEEALLHGALHCAVGSIRAAADTAREHGVPTLILAGGGAALMQPYIQGLSVSIASELVTQGLALYAQVVEKPAQSA